MKIGNIDITDCKLGNTQIQKVLLGNTLVWDRFAWTFTLVGTDSATYDGFFFTPNYDGSQCYTLPTWAEALMWLEDYFVNIHNEAGISNGDTITILDCAESHYWNVEIGGGY